MAAILPPTVSVYSPAMATRWLGAIKDALYSRVAGTRSETESRFPRPARFGEESVAVSREENAAAGAASMDLVEWTRDRDGTYQRVPHNRSTAGVWRVRGQGCRAGPAVQ
jgi:hypothetical protein